MLDGQVHSGYTRDPIVSAQTWRNVAMGPVVGQRWHTLGRERGTVSGSSKPPGIIANESVRAERANVLHCSGANAISVVSWDNAETDAVGGRGRERGNQPHRLKTACFHCERKWPCRACRRTACSDRAVRFPFNYGRTWRGGRVQGQAGKGATLSNAVMPRARIANGNGHAGRADALHALSCQCDFRLIMAERGEGDAFMAK